MNETSSQENWYAYKVFYNKIAAVKLRAEHDGLRCFIPMRLSERVEQGRVVRTEEPAIASLIFIRSARETMERIRKSFRSRIGVYCHPGTSVPAEISDGEMERFIFVTTTGCRTLEAVDERIVRGDRVRITGGTFAGAEGYITRVHGTKRFVVVIEGIAAIATTFIPRTFIEKIENQYKQ